MLILLPILAFISVVISLAALKAEWPFRLAIIRGTALLAAYMVLASETLSLFGAITKSWTFILWAAPILGAGILLRRRIREVKEVFRDVYWLPATWGERLALVAILILCLTTAVVAWLAPPNTWDSLNTHMSRVAHWAQNQSLQPYATGIEKQLYYSPFPGIAILQSYVLTSGDRWANFVQWTAMILSAVGVSYLASQFKARSRGQWLAAVFALTLPTGIAQATSTMTDYLVALWLISVAVESVRLAKREFAWEGVALLSLAAGLAINTKPVAFAYLLPFAIYAAVHLLRLLRLPRFLLAGAASAFIVLVINAGYFSRNLALYDHPLGPQTGIDVHSNELRDWRMVVSNTLRNASLHAWSPIRKLNAATYITLEEIHGWMGLGLADPRTSVHDTFGISTPKTDEKKASNFFHALLILASLALFASKREPGRLPLTYALTVLSTFVLLSTAFKFSIFGSRYHLAFFILFAPFVGSVLDRRSSWPFLATVGVLLFLASWPWLVGVDQRPLLPKAEGGISLLEDSRQDLYFPEVAYYRERYQEMTSQISDRKCDAVAIILGGGGAEYPFWVYLGAPKEDVRIEWLVEGAPSAAYNDPSFQPCAVICDESCPEDWQAVRGLPLYDSKSGYSVYLR